MIDPSKDRFAYFKDNIQTAEDKEFDASQYYYHREDLTNKTTPGVAAAAGNALNLSGFQGMAGGLGLDVDGGATQPSGVFSGFHGSMMGAAGSNSFMSASRGSLGGSMPESHELHRMNSSEQLSVKARGFQLQTETKAPDMSEFPALGRTNSWSMGNPEAAARQQSEFVIQKEDFPALSPFGNNSNDKSSIQQHAELKRHASFTSSVNDSMATQQPTGLGGNTSIGSRSGAPVFHQAPNLVGNGSGVSNVSLGGTGAFGPLHGSRPGSSATNGELDPSNKFGLLGMLHSVIRPSNDAKQNLLMGCDLTSLGLNLNAAEPLHPIFASPWSDDPLTKEPQFTLPMCYYNQPPALKTTHLSKFHLETLFYIFYSMPKDVLQAYAAQELYSRDWRYHTELKIWLKRASAADAALFSNGPALTPSAPSGSIGSIGSIGSGPSTGAAAASAAALGAMGPQFLYFDATAWERRVFTGNIHSISTGLLTEDEIRVKFAATS
ncbi:hypothetical protein Poli38472_000087 [Pythium oligandrum]|uniref:NOT2/NOT3/NOT5 C-terminal domain-containing protein n=1 Tax=Pythium oligandrum TaxID=41045 RepID=A0A8K1FE19_PYTOL|nr:hypothetical protein Poli38472_000087 [Pythium oligandrum]|eukprot:TMW60045.1 hypothetical protein Poli38472_000087 [Pythium oligandrum]